MKITKNKFFGTILIFGIITDLLVLANIHFLYIRAIITFGFLAFVPGLLVLLSLNIKKLNLWETLVYIVGLSISFLMAIGYAINSILPWLHITNKPLSLTPALISLNIILPIIGFVAYKRNKSILANLKTPNLSLINKIFFLIPLLFPIISSLGAITLNNGGLNYLTKIALIGIAIYVFLIALLKNKLNENIYPCTVLLTSLSFLLMYSLRSWFISGWDISREMYVFRLTSDRGIWLFKSYVDTYSSCLSLSILPTIIKVVTGLGEGVIFKLIFQIIFVFHSLTVYLIFRRYSKAVLSFIASLLYFGGVYYNSTFPTLIRQEIAFLFFGLMFLILFSKNITPIIRNSMFLILGFSMVVSHYSTSYIAAGIFLFTYIFTQLYKFIRVKVRGIKGKYKDQFYLSWKTILLLFAFQFLWMSQFSVLPNDVTFTFKNTYKNIQNILSEDLKISSVTNSIFGKLNPEKYTDKELRGYINDNKYLYINSDTYSDNQTDTYLPMIKENEVIETKNPYLKFIFVNLYSILKYSLILSFLVGSIIIFLDNKILIDKEFSISIIVSVVLMLLIFLLPYVANVYNFERLFQQSLMFLSISSIVFFQRVLKGISNNLLVCVLLLICLGYSYYGMGLMLTLTGGSPTLNLYNKGFAFNTFYSHSEEISSINWLNRHYDGDLVYTDPYSQLKFFAFGDPTIKTDDKVIPSLMLKTSYVYSSYSNTIKKTNYLDVRERFTRGVLSFNFPTEFFNDNKNIIYSNGVSEIFK